MRRIVIVCAAAACWLATFAAPQAGQADTPGFTSGQAESGRQLYLSKCAGCHGPELQGGGGPALAGRPYRQRLAGPRALGETYETITERMPPDAVRSIAEPQALDVIAFILQRNGVSAGQIALNRSALAASLTFADDTHPAPAATPQPQGTAQAGAAPAAPPVPRPARFPADPQSVKKAKTAVPDDKELLDSRAEDWLLTNQDLRGQRFSPLKQITTGNVGKLLPTCILQIGDSGGFQTRPIVYKGRLYLTTTHKTVAVDAVTCKRLWEHNYVPKDREPLPNNRGAALYRGKVYRGTGDGHLLALDAETGEELWDAWVADSTKSYFVAAAPLAFGGKVFVGEGGGDYPIDAHFHAFDSETGKHLWTFDTIRKEDPKSWPANSNTGGGGTWTGATLDPTAGVVYFPVGNPYPSYIGGGRSRPGDNLYTDSIVGLDVNSGKLAWYAQQETHDLHDWDTAPAPVLYDIGNKTFMAVGSKNGFLHIYDRATHQQIAKSPVSRIENQTKLATDEGMHVCPGQYGGVAQNGQAYDPITRMLFVTSIDRCSTFFDSKRPVVDPMDTAFGWVRGYDAATGREAWATRMETPMEAGATPTAGGVVFTGDLDGFLLAFDSKTGKELFRFNTGGPIGGAISTYDVKGKQYVAVPSGSISRGIPWKVTVGSPTLVIFALP